MRPYLTTILRKVVIALIAINLIGFVETAQAQQTYKGRRTISTRSKSNKSRAQWKIYRWEASLGAGLSNYLGDLGGGAQEGSHYLRDFNIQSTRWAISTGIRYKVYEMLAVRSDITFGYISGDDKLSADMFRNNRNLSFRSPIFEINTTLEFGISKEQLGHRYDLKGVYGERAFNVGTHIFAGVGLFYFNPQTLYKDAWVNLQPLGTEGQGLAAYPTRHPYSKWQMCFPVGFGFRYNFNRNVGVSFEYGFRVTFTDYLDDVSQTYVDQSVLLDQRGKMTAELSDRSTGKIPTATTPGEERGNPNYADSYMFAIFKVHYKLYRGPYVRSKLLWF